MFTDFTIDGNQSNQTGWNANIYEAGPTSKFTALRMRNINSGNTAIQLALSTGNNADVLIADSDFENNGLRAGCTGIGLCADISVQEPLRVRITRNRSDGSQNFLFYSGHNGAGNVVTSENVVNSCLQFAVALGGGGTNPGPAGISDNIFNCPTSNANIVDIALWSDVRVANNTITVGTANNGIADGPPANKVVVTGNRIFGNPAASTGCIVLGGSDVLIANNLCSDAGGGGIAENISATAQKSIVISNNTVKNASRFSSGSNPGISFFITPGGSLTGVIVKGNKLYDDQGSPTQGWGIGLAIVGQTTGYSNFTIEGNDVRGNKTGGILNNATATSGFLVLNNPGDTNVGVCVSIASPAVCGVASSGSVAIANPATTIVVNTTAVTAASKIQVFEDSSLGALLGVTCNATLGRTYMVTARTAGTSFTITASATPAVNSACLNYHIDPAN
jgi:hypothetical protein